jgi:hypothetical protein
MKDYQITCGTKVPLKRKTKMKNQNTIGQFIHCCWQIMQKAKRQGATVKDLYEIARDAGAPKCTFSTFSTTYFKVGKSRRVLVESVA